MEYIEKKPPVPLIPPNRLFPASNNNDIPITITKWIVRSYLSYLITGDQGCGKTTFLKSMVRYYDPSAAIRTNEIRPELNLRYAYPDRNIVAFYETSRMSMQDGLNFQKKTSGVVNIIGEIASAEEACFWVQTTKVASKAGAGSHHGKTIDDTITALRDNIVQVAHFTDPNAVEVMVAEALDFDIHMCREEGYRFNERITEVLPIKQRLYPYPDYHDLTEGNIPMAQKVNELEYYARMTDRKNYTTKNICEYDREAKCYVFTNMFSEPKIAEIKRNLPKQIYEMFEKDMDRLLSYNRSA